MRIIIEDDYRFAAAPGQTATPFQTAPVVTIPGQLVQNAPPIGASPAQFAGFGQVPGAGFAGVPAAATPGIPAAPTLNAQNAGEPAPHIHQIVNAHAMAGTGTGARSMATGFTTPAEAVDAGAAPEWLKRANLLSVPTSKAVS